MQNADYIPVSQDDERKSVMDSFTRAAQLLKTPKSRKESAWLDNLKSEFDKAAYNWMNHDQVGVKLFSDLEVSET
jgi:hypothetical protein